jgi:hypothetical protein
MSMQEMIQSSAHTKLKTGEGGIFSTKWNVAEDVVFVTGWCMSRIRRDLMIDIRMVTFLYANLQHTSDKMTKTGRRIKVVTN